MVMSLRDYFAVIPKECPLVTTWKPSQLPKHKAQRNEKREPGRPWKVVAVPLQAVTTVVDSSSDTADDIQAYGLFVGEASVTDELEMAGDSKRMKCLCTTSPKKKVVFYAKINSVASASA